MGTWVCAFFPSSLAYCSLAGVGFPSLHQACPQPAACLFKEPVVGDAPHPRHRNECMAGTVFMLVKLVKKKLVRYTVWKARVSQEKMIRAWDLDFIQTSSWGRSMGRIWNCQDEEIQSPERRVGRGACSKMQCRYNFLKIIQQ